MNNEFAAQLIAYLHTGADLKARFERIACGARRSLTRQQQDGRVLPLAYLPDAAGELRELIALEQECCVAQPGAVKGCGNSCPCTTAR